MAMSPRLLRPRASGFNPKSLSGLAGWYDASVASSLYDATSDGSAVAAGGAVARWEDISGNGRHLTQSTANNRPILAASKYKGRAACEFDGSNDQLLLASNLAMSAGATIILVSQKRSNNNSAMHSLRGSGTANHHPYTDGNAYDSFGVFNRLTFAFAYRSDLLVWSAIAANANLAVYVDNAAKVNSSGIASANQTGSETQVVGSGTTTNWFWDGWIAEILMYSRALSATENTSVYNYLKSKWGTA